MSGFKYGMSMNLATTHHHPYGSGAEHLSAEELVRRGYAAHKSYPHVASELQELANVNEGNSAEARAKFAHAAELARERGYRLGEYKGACKVCGRRHGHSKRKVTL